MSSIATVVRNVLARAISVRRLIRVAAHVAAWTPFLISVAASWLGSWRVVGDGAVIALGSWATFTRIPLVGQPTEFLGSPHDLGPAEYWLLAIPVHIDPARGVLWGAALLCMVAASLAIEAAWSVIGETGALLASAVILGIAAWMPGLAFRPYWNPYFGAMFFLAALAATWAVMSGHRRWWPALVVTASIAAQAHLMFALASVALTLMALITGLADGFRARTSCRWVITGLAAGLACWMAPLDQQLTNPPGNLSLLLQAQATGQHAELGPAFAMRTLTAFTEPPPLWSRLHLGQRQHIYRLLEAKPAGFAIAILAITAATLLIAAFGLRSRRLTSLAAITLLISATAAITISRIPSGHGDRGRLSYMIIVMFPAGLLIWLTLASAFVLAGRQLISGRLPAAHLEAAQPPAGRRSTRQYLTRLTASYGRAAAVPLILLASVPGLVQQSGRHGAGQNAHQVGVAAGLIEQTLPSQPDITLSVSTPKPDHYQIVTGLLWALTGDGYSVDFTRRGLTRPIPHVTILMQDRTITVEITKSPFQVPIEPWGICAP
jgi:hypothetical protein